MANHHNLYSTILPFRGENRGVSEHVRPESAQRDVEEHRGRDQRQHIPGPGQYAQARCSGLVSLAQKYNKKMASL